uniref:Adropin n=1 Tax=Hippocampus comes TaxID=109280 RepID=A0A3Q2XYS3_HIPCM
METEESLPALSTAALVAIVCNAFAAIFLLLLCLVLYRACRVPSSPDRLMVLSPSEGEGRPLNEKYLLTS